MDQKRFDFDSMLMYGWVADRDLKVRAVNFSLENWLTTHEEYNPRGFAEDRKSGWT